MPRLTIDLPTDVSIALRRMAHRDQITREEASVVILRDWLIGHGYIEMEPKMDEGTETMGQA